MYIPASSLIVLSTLAVSANSLHATRNSLGAKSSFFPEWITDFFSYSDTQDGSSSWQEPLRRSYSKPPPQEPFISTPYYGKAKQLNMDPFDPPRTDHGKL